MPYHYSSSHYSASKPIIRDPRYDSSYTTRDSSADSRASYYSRSSAEYSSRSGSGYCGSTDQRAYEESKRKHRVPDNGESAPPRAAHAPTNSAPSTGHHYITSTRGEKVDIVHHHKPRYDNAEPRTSEATSTHYNSSQSRSSKSSSSHKHR